MWSSPLSITTYCISVEMQGTNWIWMVCRGLKTVAVQRRFSLQCSWNVGCFKPPHAENVAYIYQRLSPWLDLFCGILQQYHCSAATQIKHDNLVSRADLTAKMSLRAWKYVNSLLHHCQAENVLLSETYALLIKYVQKCKETLLLL